MPEFRSRAVPPNPENVTLSICFEFLDSSCSASTFPEQEEFCNNDKDFGTSSTNLSKFLQGSKCGINKKHDLSWYSITGAISTPQTAYSLQRTFYQWTGDSHLLTMRQHLQGTEAICACDDSSNPIISNITAELTPMPIIAVRQNSCNTQLPQIRSTRLQHHYIEVPCLHDQSKLNLLLCT